MDQLRILSYASKPSTLPVIFTALLSRFFASSILLETPCPYITTLFPVPVSSANNMATIQGFNESAASALFESQKVRPTLLPLPG